MLLSRLMICLIALFVSLLGLCPASIAFVWTLHFAPLNPTTGDTGAFNASASVPVTPQFLRISVTGNQVVIGAEDPYIRPLQLIPPIHFKQPSRSVSQPIAGTQTLRPGHQLRGPEALLLRRSQTVAGSNLP